MGRSVQAVVGLSSLVLAASFPAQAQQQLTILEVNAPAVNCVFQPSCRITVSDSTGNIALPFIATPGTAWLQSRIYNSAPGTPAAGQTGYVYRVSLTQASGTSECLRGLVLNFGPVTRLPYAPNQMADVFVITQGGLGTIKLASAVKTGNVIEFAFNKPLCLNGPPDINNTTFFFGLAAPAAPSAAKALIWASGSPSFFEVDARVPAH